MINRQSAWLALIQTLKPWGDDGTLWCYADVRLDDQRQTQASHFTNTYSSYLLARITLTWGMRSTQQPRDSPGASVWRLRAEKHHMRTQLWLCERCEKQQLVWVCRGKPGIAWRKFAFLYSLSLAESNIDTGYYWLELRYQGRLTFKTLALPCAEHLDSSIIISSHSRLQCGSLLLDACSLRLCWRNSVSSTFLELLLT